MLPRFDYIKPETLEEAIRILSEGDQGVKICAGGTDLFVQMKRGGLHPPAIVDIKAIPPLRRLSLSPGGELMLGATVTLSELQHWARDKREWTGLSMAAGSIGSEQVKNRATVVGNVCRASPAGDMAPMLIALGAKAQIEGPRGKRQVPVEDFVTGPGQTVLKKGEMVVSLTLERPLPSIEAVYLKYGIRRAMEVAVVAVAVTLSFEPSSNRVREARLVLGAVAPTPLRVPEAERIMVQEGLSPAVLEKISQLAVVRSKPITDLRGTEDYRQELVKVLTRRAVEQAWRGEGRNGEGR